MQVQRKPENHERELQNISFWKNINTPRRKEKTIAIRSSIKVILLRTTKNFTLQTAKRKKKKRERERERENVLI
jgi:hypothetical protein